MSAAIHWRVCLGHEKILFPIAREIINVVQNPSIVDFAVRRLDKTKFVNARKRRHRTDQADVRTFRCFDRADASVMGRMDVAYFESSAIAAQTARPERRETTLVG